MQLKVGRAIGGRINFASCGYEIPAEENRAQRSVHVDGTGQFLSGWQQPIELAESVKGANRVLEYIRNFIAQRAPAPDKQNES